MGMIRARISDEAEEKIESIINEVREEAFGGVEINLSTVIRYALDNYIKEYEERKQDIKTVKFDLKAIEDKEKLEKLLKASEEIGELFKAGYEGEFGTGIDCFYLSEAIRYRLFELNQKRDK